MSSSGRADEPKETPCDVAVVGAGAAGLMAAIFAGRIAPKGTRIVALDSARTLGAKILVAGGGRCNVTHHAVTERDYCGSTPPAIRKVLARFDVQATRAFFADLGVKLKREETGKLFPVTDRARTVLDALLHAARDAGVRIEHPCRVEAITALSQEGDSAADPEGAQAKEHPPGFRLTVTGEGSASIARPGPARTEPAARRTIIAQRVILATGGCALPKSGSDGHGHVMARALGHTTTPAIFPALVPLVVAADCFLRQLSGITLPARLTVVSGMGKHLASTENSTLITHFGLSGPSALDISRHLFAARREDPGAGLEINWLPGEPPAQLDELLRDLGKRSVHAWLRGKLPDRLAHAIAGEAKLPAELHGAAMTREQRRRLLVFLTAMPAAVTGDRGFTFAETTAGGVPLAEIDLRTMQSRRCPGLYVIGEVLDVDGRIGGFNFQWAWASGFIAGTACGEAIVQ